MTVKKGGSQGDNKRLMTAATLLLYYNNIEMSSDFRKSYIK